MEDEVVDESITEEESTDEAITDEVVDESITEEESTDEAIDVVESHTNGDEDKWTDVFSRLDALELRIGELMMQGGPVKADMEEESEISDIELENQKWYERNSKSLNDY